MPIVSPTCPPSARQRAWAWIWNVGMDLEGERTLSIAWDAYERATDAQLPGGSFSINYPPLDPAWDFDFDDHGRIAARLPRIAALFTD